MDLYALVCLLLLLANCREQVEARAPQPHPIRPLHTDWAPVAQWPSSSPWQRVDADVDDPAEDWAMFSAIFNSLRDWRNRKRMREHVPEMVNGNQSFSDDQRAVRRVKRDEEMVCYRNFGCFRDEGPFDYLDTLPASPDLINTTFTLYTRQTGQTGHTLDYQNSSVLLSAPLLAAKPVKVVIHGFGSSGRRPWVLQMTEALLYMDDVNVIVVDWENGAALPNYVQAAANTQLVGKQLARLIQLLNTHQAFDSSDYHLIGFSLGAHIAGFAGAELRNISRITGLDPASPLFEGYSVRVRLDPSDARFVDVIHSNGDSFLRGGLGSFQAMGHLDFYPNGGRVQVGCNSVLVGALTDIFYGKWQSLCHHRRAFRFFIDSLVPSCRFHAFACDSYDRFLRGECFACGHSGRRCADMGYFANQARGRGKMYLVTRDAEPFCANQYRIQILSSHTQYSTWGKLEVTFVSNEGNETFQLTSESDEIKDKAIIQALVVAHPIIRNITHVSLRYTKYRGWIYSGKDIWAIDKILLQNSDGQPFSYCGVSTVVENGVSMQLELERKNCSLVETGADLPTARVARLIWKMVSNPIRNRAPFLWRFAEPTSNALPLPLSPLQPPSSPLSSQHMAPLPLILPAAHQSNLNNNLNNQNNNVNTVSLEALLAAQPTNLLPISNGQTLLTTVGNNFQFPTIAISTSGGSSSSSSSSSPFTSPSSAAAFMYALSGGGNSNNNIPTLFSTLTNNAQQQLPKSSLQTSQKSTHPVQSIGSYAITSSNKPQSSITSQSSMNTKASSISSSDPNNNNYQTVIINNSHHPGNNSSQTSVANVIDNLRQSSLFSTTSTLVSQKPEVTGSLGNETKDLLLSGNGLLNTTTNDHHNNNGNTTVSESLQDNNNSGDLFL